MCVLGGGWGWGCVSCGEAGVRAGGGSLLTYLLPERGSALSGGGVGGPEAGVCSAVGEAREPR